MVASRRPETESADQSAPYEIDVGRYSGAVRVLMAVGLPIALWGLVLFLASTVANLFQTG